MSPGKIFYNEVCSRFTTPENDAHLWWRTSLPPEQVNIDFLPDYAGEFYLYDNQSRYGRCRFVSYKHVEAFFVHVLEYLVAEEEGKILEMPLSETMQKWVIDSEEVLF